MFYASERVGGWGGLRQATLIFSLGMTFLPLGAYAEQSAGGWFDAWRVDLKEGDTYAAATFTDAGAVFGQFCYPGQSKCLWTLALPNSCQKGSTFPVLANTDTRAVPLSAMCEGWLKGSTYRYTLLDFEAVTQLVERGGRIGFAFPLQSDQFVVVRFRLNGSEAALNIIHGAMRIELNRRDDGAKPRRGLPVF